MIQEAFTMLPEGYYSVVIAHRLSTIRNADLILVVQDGQPDGGDMAPRSL